MMRTMSSKLLAVLVLVIALITWTVPAMAASQYVSGLRCGPGGFLLRNGDFEIQDSDQDTIFSLTKNTGVIAITPTTTTGSAITLDASTLTTGNALKITGVDATLNGGKYINCYGGTGTTSVFSIGETGAMLYKQTVLTNTDASETLTAAQSGTFVVCTAAGGATTITLPDPSASTVGCVFYVMQTANQNAVITCTTADSNAIVADAVATSDQVSLATANHKIGAVAMVVGISATKWLATSLSPTCPLTVEAAD